jgi:glycine/D-amino acid oxidase-like deaminating enzyme
MIIKEGNMLVNLHSGEPFWATTFTDAPVYESLTNDIACDVLIIGAGTSGAHCAHYLSQHQLDVVVIDKRRVGLGSTAVNTALLQYIGDKMFHQLANAFGESVATKHHWLCKTAIDDIESIANHLPLNPHFKRRDSLLFSSTAEDITLLQKEYEILIRNRFPVEWLTKEEIHNKYSFSKDAAITTKNDGEINPYRYTHGLLQKAIEQGARVFEQTEIVGKVLKKEGASLYTKSKNRIRAKYVIFASGYESLQFKADKNTTLVSSYAVFTNQLNEEEFSPWYKRNLIWESARPYLYIRTTADNRVVIGGLDEPTSSALERDGKIKNKKEKLIEAFNKLFPTIKVQPEYYYGAFYGGTHDGLPIVGMYEDLPNCFFLLCFGDNGIVYGKVLSEIIGEVIIKEKCPTLPLYLQTRPYKNK